MYYRLIPMLFCKDFAEGLIGRKKMVDLGFKANMVGST